MSNKATKTTTTVYWVEVWDTQHGEGHYSEFGLKYYSKNKPIEVLRDYLIKISDPSSQCSKSLYYQQQYKDYNSRSHPVKLMSQTYETYTYPIESNSIHNILEVK